MDGLNNMSQRPRLRVGVLFGGRSGEHEVSLNSARNVMDALRQAGHEVIPMGITQTGQWLTNGDSLAQLSAGQTPAVDVNGHHTATPVQLDFAPVAAGQPAAQKDAWALLPQSADDAPLPAVDVIFPVLHGTYGEDGTVQGLLEMANLPYVGCGVLASAVGMDKIVAKQLCQLAGLPQPAFCPVLRHQWRQDQETVLVQLETELGYPMFVKPANLGSSVGISKAHNRSELMAGLTLAARYDRKLVVEAAVPNAREIEVSVLGNETPVASVPGEIVPGGEFYDYAAKYLNDASDLLIPAPLDAATTAAVQRMAVDAFQLLDGAGLARVDFLMDDATGELFLNEVNTMPGFTRISMYPKLWEASGISYPQLVDRLLELALERFDDRQQNSTTRE